MVQRYNLIFPENGDDGVVGVIDSEFGRFVRHADYTALERERDELQAKVIEQDDKLYKAEKRLEVACHVKADDKVGFDFAVLDKIDSLERERDELKEAFAKDEKAYAELSEKYFRLEQDNALLRKRLEPIEAAHMEYEEYPSSAIVKRDAYDKAINRCMELEEGK